MRSHHTIPLALLLSAIVSNALRIPVTGVRKTSSDPLRRRSQSVSVSRPVAAAANSPDASDALNLTTIRDLLYLANITIGSIAYPVQLDTGSSDLWVHASSSPVPGATPTTTPYNLTYDIGWASGYISYAAVEFAGLSVSSQAFLDASEASNPALSYNADGILGLGFDSLSSIDAMVNRSDASTGRTFLYNAFAKSPSEPNFMAFSLQSVEDSDDEIQGTFSIGEYEPQYAAVQNSSTISTWPVSSPSRWNVLLDALLVGSNTVSLSSSVSDVPSGKAVIMLDSGTSYTYAPTAVVDAIYGGISGAQYDLSVGQWIVPCTEEVDIALQFGDSVYPINPLDITPISMSGSSTCVGTIINETIAVGNDAFDWLIGVNLLRSFYSVYDFGDYDSSGKMGDPYIKLLPLINPDQASIDFHQARGGSPVNVTYNAANSSSSDLSGGSTSVTLSNELVDTLNKVGKYLPAVLAIMALNALILLLLIVAALIYMYTRRNRGAKARKTRGRLSPMPMNPTSTFGVPTRTESHIYQPVSMALTDDTFVPPSPAFSKPGFYSDMRGAMGERPKSVA
ncbi:aspartic peptidase domain-containing protein [Sparassis latifolia]